MNADPSQSRELIESIVFGMEDQDHAYVLDTEDGLVVQTKPDTDHSDSERFVALPPWQSIDGYNLMSRFVQSLRNPVFRERLREVLTSGRGVFRQFKNIVGERADIQRLWLRFKQREMNAIVVDWLNNERELRGLERLELPEDEETEPLIESDFVFRIRDREAARLAAELDEAAFRESQEGSPEAVELRYRVHQTGWPGPADDESRTITVETPAGETAGLLWSVLFRGSGALLSVVRLIYVVPEYRGLGLASSLLREHMRRCRSDSVDEVRIDLAGWATDFEETLEDLGFGRSFVSLSVSTDDWYRENESGT